MKTKVDQVINKIKGSLTSVEDMRLSPFMPIDRVSHTSVVWKTFQKQNNQLYRTTPYGTIVVKEKILTQKHLAIFVAILMSYQKIKNVGDNQIALYFSLQTISQKIGKGWSGQSSDEIQEKIEDMTKAVIIRQDSKACSCKYKIFSHFAYSDNEKSWGVILSDEYIEQFNNQLSIDFRTRINDIQSIQGEGSALVKSIILHFLTHKITETKKVQNINLEKLLMVVGYPTSDRQIRSAKTIINKFSDDLEKFNIKFNKKSQNVSYIGTKGIKFIKKINSQTSPTLQPICNN